MKKSDSSKDSNKKIKKSVRRQEASREIEDRHQDLLSHIKAVQYTHDLQGQLLSVNQETTEFLGYDKNSLLNMNIRSLLAPEVRHEFDTYLTEMKKQGNAKGLMLVQTATGEKRILIYNNTLQVEGVAIPTVQGIAYDATKYMQTERELRQVSGQLSIVLGALPVVCYISKAEEDYGATYITHNTKAITGFEDTNFTSKSSFWADRIHPEDAPRIFANLPQIFEKGYHEHQYRWQVADGSYKWFYDYTRLMKSSDGKNYIIGMMQDITERKRTEEALLHAAQQWRATFDGINDFVSLLDLEGKILRCNKALSDFVEKPFNEIINHSYWEIILGTTTPIEDCPFLRMKGTLHRETTILSVNDLWFNVSVDPIFDQASHLIGAVNIISDITKRKQAEEAVNRLAQENATVAKIGRIISSTLNIEEVYERFAEEVRKLISFDRISIHIVNPDNNTTSTVYVSGIEVLGRRGDTTPLKGTAVSECIRTRSGMLIQSESVDECLVHFPALLPTFQAGLKSIMYVPLISKDRVIGALSLRSAKTNAYTDQDVKLAENIGNQIAGAIANAQLFIERKRAEEAVNRLAQENAIIAEIGRIISSTLEIEEVYEQFAKEVHKLILFDGIAINMINYEQGILTVPFVSEVAVPGCQPGEVLPLAGSVTEKVMQTRPGLIIQTEDRDEIKDQFPTLLTAFDKGLRSLMVVPLIYKDQVIGALHFRSVKSEAYSDKHLELAASIGNQIAGAIANAQLFVERKRAEENLRASEERYRSLFHGVPVGLFRVTPMGQILDINKALVSILGYRDRESLMAVRVDDTYVNPKDRVEFKTLIETQGGVRHLEAQLRRYDGTIIWVESNAHAVSNSQGQIIYYEGSFIDITHRKQAEEALLRSEEAAKRLAQENATMAEIGRIISSTLNIEEVYERFAEEVRKLIPLDRIALTTINPDHRSGTMAYVLGVEVRDRNQGAVFPLAGSLYEEIFSKRSGILVQTEDESELAERYPILLSTLKVGLRSMISVPLISKGQIIGILHIRSLKPNAYTELDLKLAERVGNQIAGAIANAQLFAERKQAEEALRTEKQRFQTVSENAPFGMAMIDQTGTYKYINPKFKELFGYDLNDIPDGKAWYRKAFPDPAYRHHAISVWINDNRLGSHRGGEKTIRTFTVTCKDGTEKIIEFLPVELETGEFLTSFVDITLRKKAEDALQKSEEAATRLAKENAIIAEIGRIISSSLNIDEVYEHFAEEVRKLIPFDRIVINFIDIEKGTVVNVYMAGKGIVDRRVEEIHPLRGSGNAEMVRTKSTFLIQTEDFNKFKDRFPMLLSTFQSGFRSIMNVPLFSKGQIIGGLLLRSFMPYAYSDKDVRLAERIGTQIAGAIANAQLFNERLRSEEKMRDLEDQLRQAQKMEAIGRLAGGVAHDFNNLLTAIKGYSQISLAMLKEGDPLKENVEEIQKAADRAASLTKQLLVFSRSQILELKVFHLNTILQDLGKMLHRIIGEDIELVYSLSNDLGQVKTDPSQMEQVILNLAINAKDAMPSGGKLTIETSNATLDESYADSHIGITSGDYVMLSVSDTGMGMTPEVKERIFEPFFTTKEKGKGTGLGLSIVYGIIKQSGGTIWVYSELGLGTTFKVYLPRVEEDAESLRPTTVPTKSLQGSETILVVEDEEIVRKMACKILEKNGYRVLEASNGEEALHIVQKQNGNPIHLVVTDVVMPGMSGRQLVDRLVFLWPQTKALYMSGYTNDAIVHHGVLDPGIAFIQKPFTPDDLILKVRKVLDGP